jgi:hypothetical protein
MASGPRPRRLGPVHGARGELVKDGYDHEIANDRPEVSFKRVKRVSLVVKKRLWPKPKRQEGTDGQTPMKIAGGDDPREAEAA